MSDWMENMGRFFMRIAGRGESIASFLVSAHDEEKAFEDMHICCATDPRILVVQLYRIIRLDTNGKGGWDEESVYLLTGRYLKKGKWIWVERFFKATSDEQARNLALEARLERVRLYRCEALLPKQEPVLEIPRDPTDCRLRLGFVSFRGASGYVHRIASSYPYHCHRCGHYHIKNLGPPVGTKARLRQMATER